MDNTNLSARLYRIYCTQGQYILVWIVVINQLGTQGSPIMKQNQAHGHQKMLNGIPSPQFFVNYIGDQFSGLNSWFWLCFFTAQSYAFLLGSKSHYIQQCLLSKLSIGLQPRSPTWFGNLAILCTISSNRYISKSEHILGSLAMYSQRFGAKKNQ